MRNNQQSVNFTGTQNCMYVGTINDLRMFKPLTDGQVVLCSGQTYVADGQGNFYSWSSTATGVDDGVSIILSQYSGQTGRWLILNKQGNIDAVVASLNAEITNRMTADNTLQANINAETSRAEQAEQQLNANKVNRDGDVMYGTLHIQNNAGIQNTSSYTHTSGNIEVSNGLSINANSGNIFDISMKQNDNGYYGSLSVQGTEYVVGSSSINNTNRLLTTSDIGSSYYSNGYNMTVGNILFQGFTYTNNSPVNDGMTCTFPVAFASGTVPVVTMAINVESSQGHSDRAVDFTNTSSDVNQPNITNTGFTFRSIYLSTGQSSVPLVLNVMAIGRIS